MQVPAQGLDREATYKLMTGIVVPRPIAWITTRSEDGVINLAPFSAFAFVSMVPPMVGVNISRKSGALKDTALNMHRSGEFVVNIADDTNIEAVHLSGIEYERTVSEPELLKLDLAPSELVKTPRLAAAAASLECRFRQSIKFGTDDSEFLVGEVVMFHIRDDLYANGKVDSCQLRPICRIGGPTYAKLGEVVSFAGRAGKPA